MDTIKDRKPRLKVERLHLAEHPRKRRLGRDVLRIGVGLIEEAHDALVSTARRYMLVSAHIRRKDVEHAGAVERPDVTTIREREEAAAFAETDGGGGGGGEGGRHEA